MIKVFHRAEVSLQMEKFIIPVKDVPILDRMRLSWTLVLQSKPVP